MTPKQYDLLFLTKVLFNWLLLHKQYIELIPRGSCSLSFFFTYFTYVCILRVNILNFDKSSLTNRAIGSCRIYCLTLTLLTFLQNTCFSLKTSIMVIMRALKTKVWFSFFTNKALPFLRRGLIDSAIWYGNSFWSLF